jgi:hypothetical protein
MTQEIRRLGANDLHLGEGITVSPKGKSVTRLNASQIPLKYGSANDATTDYSNIEFSVDDALSAVIDVRAYGATGDGTTDDISALNNASAAISAGGTLYFPPGIYAISETFSLKSGVRYLGCGGRHQHETAQSTNDLTHGAVIKWIGSDDSTIVEGLNVNGIVWDGIGVTGGENNKDNGYTGIHIYGDGVGSKNPQGNSFRNFEVWWCHIGMRIGNGSDDYQADTMEISNFWFYVNNTGMHIDSQNGFDMSSLKCGNIVFYDRGIYLQRTGALSIENVTSSGVDGLSGANKVAFDIEAPANVLTFINCHYEAGQMTGGTQMRISGASSGQPVNLIGCVFNADLTVSGAGSTNRTINSIGNHYNGATINLTANDTYLYSLGDKFSSGLPTDTGTNNYIFYQSIFNVGLGTTDFGGGYGIFGVKNAVIAPTTDDTGRFLMYSGDYGSAKAVPLFRTGDGDPIRLYKQSHVADPSGGGTQDAEARTAISSILAILENAGLMATS